MREITKELLHKKQIKAFLLLQVFLLAMIGSRCFQPKVQIFSLRGDDLAGVEEREDASVYYEGERMTLTPGVYQVKVQSNTAEGQSMYLQMLCDRSSFRTLRGNTVIIFPLQQCSSFEFYVLEKIDSAYLALQFFGGLPEEELGQVDIYKTNLGWRMLWVIVFSLFLALDGLILLRQAILRGAVSRTQQLVVFALMGGVLLAYFPYLTDYFSLGADTAFHLQRIEELKNTILINPAFPIRLHNTWVYDHGYMASVFYGDLFLMFPVLLRFCGFSLMSSYKIFVFFVMVLTAVIAYVSIVKCVRDEKAALFGSMIYLLAPYRIYNFYNRGAAGEYLGMVFMPLVCCGMYLLLTESTDTPGYGRRKWYIIAGMTAILQSHLLSTEMAACFMLITCVICRKKVFRRKTFIQLAQATGAVLLLNCWYWLPMLYMLRVDSFKVEFDLKGNIQRSGTWFARLFQWVPDAGNTHLGIYDGEPIQIGVAAVMLLALYVFGRIQEGRFREIRSGASQNEKAGTFFMGLILLAQFMSTKYFPWDTLAKIPGISFLVSSLQFPTRFMAPATVFCSFFAAFFYVWIKERKSGSIAAVLLCAVMVSAVAAALYHTNSIASHSGPLYLYTAENMGTVSVGNGEYLLGSTWKKEYSYHDPAAEEGLLWSNYSKKGTEIRMSVQNTSDRIKYLELPLSGYLGYAVEGTDRGGRQPGIADSRGAHEDLRIEIPGGYEGDIRVWYKGLPVFRVAEGITAAGSVLILLWEIVGGRKNGRHRKA